MISMSSLCYGRISDLGGLSLVGTLVDRGGGSKVLYCGFKSFILK